MEAEGEGDRRSDSERAERSRTSSSSESADEERGSRASLGAGSLNLYTTLGLSAEDVDALAQIPESEISIETLPHLIMQLKAKRAEQGSTPPPKAEACDDPGEEDDDNGGGGGGRPRSASKSPAHSQTADCDPGHGKHERRGPRHSKPPHERAHASSPPKFPLSYMEEDMREALPRSFPHTCSLCHCTLYSVATWKDHLNGARHDDGRREFLRRSDSHAGGDDVLPVRRDSRSSAARRRPYSPGERPLPPLDRHHHHLKPKAGTKVVVTKFPRGSVGVEDLLNLAKPFGTVVKHLVFPCKGFLEFSTHEEAADMVAHYVAKPAFVKDNRLALYLSPMVGSIHAPKLDKAEKRPKRLGHTSVVCFSHLPPDKDGESEVLEVAKMFGDVRSSEVSNNEVLIEMEDWKDAEIMVKYYHTNPLKICGKNVRVSVSSSSHKRPRLSPDPSRRGDSSRGYSSWTKSKDPPRSSRPKTKEKAAPAPAPPKEPTGGEQAEIGDGGEPRAAEESQPAVVVLDSAGEDEQGMKADDEEEEEEKEESGPGAAAEGAGAEQEAEEARGSPGEEDEPTPAGSPGVSAKDPMEEAHESEEGEDMDFPDNMDDFVTLDELDNDAGGNIDSAESIQGGRVVTVRRIRKGYGLEDALLKLAEPFGRVTNHTISFYRQEALIELESHEAANRMIQFFQGGKKALVFGRPVSVSMCLTLQKLEGPSGRSIYIGKLPLQKYSDISLLRLAQPFGKISAYHLNWRYRKCYIQMESVEAAQSMVQKYLRRPPKFYGSVIRICLCRKGDSQIPWKAPNKYQLWCVQRQKYQTPEDELDLELELEDEDEAENGQAAEKPGAQKTRAEEDVQAAVSDSDQGSGAPASDRPSSREEKGELEKDVATAPLGPYQPDNPVGMDYIVQRTGFFCKLCKVFYTNEKTAKSIHCCSLTHYQKLKKKLAEDDPGE